MVNPNPKAQPDFQHARSHPLRAEAVAWIRNHLFVNGEKDLRPIYERYEKGQGIAHHTVWGWIRQVKSAGPGKPELTAAVARIDEVLSDENIGKHLPVAPSPNYIARSGERGLRNLDILAELHNVQSDAMMLRAHSVKIESDPETGEEREKIKNPLLFEKQMQRRLNVIDTTLKAMGEVWNLRTMQAFYETVVEEIQAESPETARRIMQRLAALNARKGMTLNMGA